MSETTIRLLHTSDVHLRTPGDPSWQAFELVCRVAEEHRIPIIAVSGDLFDQGAETHKLKAALRSLFQGRNFNVVILPGNHDLRLLFRSDYFGGNVRILSEPAQYVDVGGVRIIGFPYEKIVGEKVLERLRSVKQTVKPGATNIVLYHGELLDLLYPRERYGDEDEGGYMPVRLSFFDRLGIDYVLAGHLHTSFEVRQYEGGYFVYSGSPVSVTTNDTGIRKAALIEVGKAPEPVELETQHYEEIKIHLDPFSGRNPLDEIHEHFVGRHPTERLLVKITGYVDLRNLGISENEFAAAVEHLRTRQVESISSDWHEISAVLENDIFKRFWQKLADVAAPDERKAAIRDMVIRCMMEAASAN